MKINLTKKDVIWSYIGTIMSMASNLFLLPFIVYYLDEDMYGLWGVFASVGAIATLFDCGFSVTFARNITYCWSGANGLKREGVKFVENTEPDFCLMKKVLETCKRVYFLISIVALLFLLTIGTLYIISISHSVSGYMHIIAWIIYAIGTFLNLYYGYYASFLRGVGAVDQANKNTVIARAIQILLTIILLMLGLGIVGACIAYLAYGTVFRLLGKSKFFQYENIGEKLKAVEYIPSSAEMKELFSVVWHNAWRDGMISICNYFCNQISTIICSMYLTLAETGIYSLGVQIAAAIAQIAGALYTAYQPSLQEAYINKNNTKLKESMSVIVVSYVYLFIVGTIGVIFVVIPFMQVIKPSYIISVPMLLGLCLYQFMLKFRNCYTSYFSCTNRIIYLRAFVFSSILCVALSILFTGMMSYGIWGLIVAQILSQSIYNIWYWPIKAHKELELGFIEMATMGTQLLVVRIKSIFKIKRK